MLIQTKSRHFGIELEAYNYSSGSYEDDESEVRVRVRVRCISGVLWFKRKNRIVHKYPAIGFVGYRPFIEFQ